MGGFEPKNVGSPLEEIIPNPDRDIDFATAQSECEAAVDDLTADVSGIGPTAAERYLLRYEYGFNTKTLAELYGVTSPAITKQTQSVREKVLRYPSLAQVIGHFRAERAGLKDPIIDEHPLWEGQIETESAEVDAQIGFHQGDYAVPYSWMFTITGESQDGDTIRHLLVDYIIDAQSGVFLKRSLKGVSHSSWKRTPHFQNERRYTVYPLPHPNIPIKDGTLINAVEHHVTYDVRQAFDEFDWQMLEMYAKSNTDVKRPSAGLSLPNVLLDRIRQENSIEPVFEFTNETHTRNNVERLLRLYPLENPTQIPIETAKLLWNGSLTQPQTMDTTTEALNAALETSRISMKPGHRVP